MATDVYPPAGGLGGRLLGSLRDTRVLGALGAAVLLVAALVWGSIPPGGGSPDIRELHDVHIGDVVEVDYGGGKILHYRVSEIHKSVDWRDFKWLGPSTDDRLTLQTCNGWKDDDPRFIVVARRITTTG